MLPAYDAKSDGSSGYDCACGTRLLASSGARLLAAVARHRGECGAASLN